MTSKEVRNKSIEEKVDYLLDMMDKVDKSISLQLGINNRLIDNDTKSVYIANKHSEALNDLADNMSYLCKELKKVQDEIDKIES